MALATTVTAVCGISADAAVGDIERYWNRPREPNDAATLRLAGYTAAGGLARISGMCTSLLQSMGALCVSAWLVCYCDPVVFGEMGVCGVIVHTGVCVMLLASSSTNAMCKSTSGACVPHPGTAPRSTRSPHESAMACVICFEPYSRARAFECGHVATCAACTQDLTNCPICRHAVTPGTTRRLFFASATF